MSVGQLGSWDMVYSLVCHITSSGLTIAMFDYRRVVANLFPCSCPWFAVDSSLTSILEGYYSVLETSCWADFAWCCNDSSSSFFLVVYPTIPQVDLLRFSLTAYYILVLKLIFHGQLYGQLVSLDLLPNWWDLGLSENSVPLHPMVNDHYPY